MLGPTAMPRPEADEHRAEEQAVRGLAAAERVGEGLPGRDDHAGRGHRPGDADDETADQRGVPGEGEAVLEGAEERLLGAVAPRQPGGR